MEWNPENIVSGDSKFISIASASIIAKVSRDNLMERLEKISDIYYSKIKVTTRTSQLLKNGITNLHRKSFLMKSNLFNSHQLKSFTNCFSTLTLYPTKSHSIRNDQ